MKLTPFRIPSALATAIRKRFAFLPNLTVPKVANLLKLLLTYCFGWEKVRAIPFLIKIDVTPYCQLKCPVCIHSNRPDMPLQHIVPNMQMELGLFKNLVDEIAYKTMTLSLYHMGEPLLNKRIYEMIEYASSKGLNTYFTTNLSFRLSEEEIAKLVRSGLSAIIVALDGFTQDTYEITRVNGHIELVKANLTRLMTFRKSVGSRKPFVEVQSCVFEHNKHQKYLIEEFCRGLKVDSLVFVRGSPHNWALRMQPKNRPRPARRFPLCPWPYFATVVLYDGDILPCCKFRLETTYAKNQPRLIMGSIRHESLNNIFNGEAYRRSRAMCRNPGLSGFPAFDSNFCYQCKFLFE